MAMDWAFTDQLDYQQLKQRRAIAAALAARGRGFPKNKGEGLTYLGESFAEGMQDLLLGIRERRQREAEGKLPKPGGGYTPGTQSRVPAPDEKIEPEKPTKIVPPPTTSSPSVTTAPVVSDDTATVSVPEDVTPDVSAFVTPDVSVSDFPTYTPAAWPGGGSSSSSAPSFAQRFSAIADQPPPDLPLEQAQAFFQPTSISEQVPTDLAALTNRPEPMQTAASAEPVERLASILTPSPQLQQPEIPNEVSPTEPNAIDLAAPPAPAPDVPLPRGNPRTVGGTMATIANVLSRRGHGPVQVGGANMNIKDESNFDWSNASRHFDQSNPRFRGTEAAYSHGIFQEGGDEYNNMVAWRDKNYPGYTLEDPRLQAEYFAQRIEDPQYAKTYAALMGAQTQGQAADAILRGYLKPAAEHVASRSAKYLRGDEPTYNVAAATGRGGREGPVAPGSRTGTERESGDPRDDITLALLAGQQAPQQAPVTADDETAQDRRLLDVVGLSNRPRPPAGATASLGRAGSVSDALPSLPPMGAAAAGGATDARAGVTQAIIDQNAPPVPPVPGNVVAQAPEPPTVTDSIPLAPPAFGAGRAFSQAPAQVAPPPPQERAPPAPPSASQIPPASEYELTKPAPLRPRPGPLGMSEPQANAAHYMNNPNISDAKRAEYKQIYDTEEKYRKRLEEQRDADWVNDREKHERDTNEYNKLVREAPDRRIKQLADRIAIEKTQVDLAKEPLVRQKLEADLDNARADLAKKYYESGLPRQQAEQKAQLEIDNLKKTLAKPESFESGGARYERSDPTKPYSLAPGSPQPTMTEGQQKSAEFVIRTKPDLDLVERELKNGKAMTVLTDDVLRRTPIVGNTLVSDEYRRAQYALGNWGAAMLTRVSGAAVSPSEALRNLPAFIPQPGDTDRDLAEKAQRRRAFTESISSTSGDVGRALIDAENRFYTASRLPPVPVKSPDEARTLEPGRRIILPDGSEGQVPKRR